MRIYVCDICLRHLNTCIRVISNTLCFWINLSLLVETLRIACSLTKTLAHIYIHIQFITSAPSIAIDLLWHHQQHNKISYGHQQIGSLNAFVRNTNTLRITRTHIYHQNTKPITNLGNSAKLCVHTRSFTAYVNIYTQTDRETYTRSDIHTNFDGFTVTLLYDQNFHKTITFNFYICQFMSTNGQFLNRVSGWMNDRTNTSTLTAVQLFFELLISFSYRYVSFQLIIVFVTFIEKKNILKNLNIRFCVLRSIFSTNIFVQFT